MTKNEISIAITTLLDRAGVHLKTCQQSIMPHESNTWVAHMTASMICSDLVEVLLAARDAEFQSWKKDLLDDPEKDEIHG